VDGRPAGIVTQHPSHVFERIDLTGNPNPEQNALLEGRQAVRRLFDLARGPLLRATLIAIGSESYLFIVTVHQIIFDGWSRQVLNNEMTRGYEALAGNSASRLPILAVQYADFADWHKKFLESNILAEGVSWWQSRMKGKFNPAPLPGSPVRLGRTGASIAVPWSTSAGLKERLAKLAEEEEATRFVVVVAAWKALWYRYTGATDSLVFTSWANRTQREIGNLIGLFANVLPLRCPVSGDLTFRELIGRVRAEQLGALTHQSVPFETILKSLEFSAENTVATPFQTLLMYQRGLREFTASGVTFRPTSDVTSGQDKFLFTIEAGETEDAIEGVLRYRTDAIDPHLGEAMLQDFLTVLETVASNPDILLCDLPLKKEISGARPGTIHDAAKRLSSPRVAPRHGLEAQFVEIWEEMFGVPVGITDDFFDLGGDSFAAVTLFARIEALTGHRLPMVTLFETPTIQQLAERIPGAEGSSLWSSLVPIQPRGSRPPFYGVHGVGGNVLEFIRLARNLDPEQPLYGIQAQGLDGRVAPNRTVEAMAAHYIQAIRRFQVHGPYFLGGYSFGGLVAWEIAQQLIAAGQEVGRLVLIDSRVTAPKTPSIGSRLYSLASEFQPSAIADRRARFLRDRSLSKEIRRVRKAGEIASRSYLPRPLQCPVVLLRATEQSAGLANDLTNGWGPLVQGTLEVRHIPGSHATILNLGATVLAKALSECLRDTPARFPGAAFGEHSAPRHIRLVSRSALD
jgi:thioesterase domain-containing protein/acyl carrier protein